jgi:hypothetical protein
MQLRVSKVSLLLAVIVVLAALAIADRKVDALAQGDVPHGMMGRVRDAKNASVAAMGNSLIGVGFVEDSFNQGAQLDKANGSINIAMGGSSGIEQLLMLRYALAQGMHPRTVVFGFFDFYLTHPLEYTTADLVGNRAMLYYMEPEYARRFYHLSLHDRVEFEIMRRFNLFAERGDVWERVEIFRRKLGQEGQPPEASNSMGRSIDFAMLEYPSQAAFIAECGRAKHNPLIPSVREIALQAKAAGARVYFIEMPMPPAHVESFYDQPGWGEYRAHLEGMLADSGAGYIDASHWMPDESSFEDPLHLTWQGSKAFSYRLGEYLRSQGETAESLNAPPETQR